MTMADWTFQDATEIAALIRSGSLSARDALEHYLERLGRLGEDLNAIVVEQVDVARARAALADEAQARGEVWGPLHGVPMTVKESFDVAGLPTTWGNPALRDNIAQANAVVVDRLLGAGAVIFGKTNVPLALADFQSFNEVYGTTNNPFDLTRGPGGSSGGSAAALAAGLTALEMGSDIGGSIRNPAHYCGVYGHKPTWGVLPSRGHALPGVLTMTDIAVVGPLARSARDLALVVDVTGGADDLHSPGWTLDLPRSSATSLSELRVAVWADDALAPVDQTIKQRVLDVAGLVEAAGGQVDYEARPAFTAEETHERYQSLLQAAMSARQPKEQFQKVLRKRAALDPQDRDERARVVRDSTLYYRDWHALNEQRTHMRRAWHEFFQSYDLLLTPICATSAFHHDQNPQLGARTVTVNDTRRPYFEQLFWAGLTGVAYLPSTVFPTGLDAAGLPIGVQVVAREMADHATIEFARLIAEQLGGFTPPQAYGG